MFCNRIWSLEHQKTWIWHFRKRKTGDITCTCMYLINPILKTYIIFVIFFKWVCSRETSRSLPIPNSILLRYIAECGLSGTNRHGALFENLNGRLGPALDPKPYSLAGWTRSIRIQQNGAWKGMGGISIETLVSGRNWTYHLNCAIWIIIRKMVFWIVCTPNYIAMCHLKCAIQMTVRRCFPVLTHLSNQAAKSPYECLDL